MQDRDPVIYLTKHLNDREDKAPIQKKHRNRCILISELFVLNNLL